MNRDKKLDMKLKGLECSYCHEWIILRKTNKQNVFLSDHLCEEIKKKRRFGRLTGIKNA